MSDIRQLFSARAARPRVEAALRGVVGAAVYLASADGHVEESEIEALVDSIRGVLGRTVGPEQLAGSGTVALLLDEARAARRRLATEGGPAFVTHLAATLEGHFRSDALDVARQVAFADGETSNAEQTALVTLREALGL